MARGIFRSLGDALFGTPEERRARATAAELTRRAAEQARAEYETFVQECERLLVHEWLAKSAAARAKSFSKPHQIYRYVWRRAVVLESVFRVDQGDLGRARVFLEIADLARSDYIQRAPEGPYGKVDLVLTAKQRKRLTETELRRLHPELASAAKGRRRRRNRALSCVYVGKDSSGCLYVGKTERTPEARFREHRDEGTGPFKGGSSYVDWQVVKRDVSADRLDYWESYYIGYFEAFTKGHNDTAGNDPEGYADGCRDASSSDR